MTQKTTWVYKRENPANGLPKVFRVDPEKAGRWGTKVGDTCAIAVPKDIDNFIKKVPKGKVATINELRQAVAKKYKADIACPITTGIFAWISANAAEEERAEGKKDITPWWRVLKVGGELNPKYPGDTLQQKAYLEAEGHKIIKKGKKYLVANYEKFLIKF